MYDHQKIEARWREHWQKTKLYSPDLTKASRPYYNLMMFPYPSAEGLHVGNVYAFVHSDAHGRFQRLQGYNVFEPIGLDGFGIHSENYAIKIKEHIKTVSARTEKKFYEQLSLIGNGYDWDRRLETYSKSYYRHTQWLFLQMYKKGLAYRKASPVNWCPGCKTVLSDEQVIAGCCERCASAVERRKAEQWFFAITKYADRLLKNLEWIDWPADVKLNQKNWIGRSEGALIQFKITNDELRIKSKNQPKNKNYKVTVFTTRPDTLFGATYLVLSPEHSLLTELLDKLKNRSAVEKYIQKALKKTEQERKTGEKIKTGVELKGVSAVNPVTGQKIPLWIADYVLANYGTGAIMAVPAHDERDFEFAQKFKLPIKLVVKEIKNSPTVNAEPFPKEPALFSGEGIAINSDFLNGLTTEMAKKKIIAWLEKNKVGKKAVDYKLRDWCVSRQRYWGPPIPMIHCEHCGWVPVPEKDLPVELPEMEDFYPDGSGKGPLNKIPEFVNTPCPVCGGPAKRETDVSDPFVDSAWYFFRYLNVHDQKEALSKELIKKWMPIEMYIGGKEHTVLHLLYSRFITMVLSDLGYCDFEEPFKKFFGHGLVIKDGAKMSKSKGNVVNPDSYLTKYGADSVRLYLMFLGDFRQGGDWKDAGIAGIYKFLCRVYKIYETPSIAKNGFQKELSKIEKGSLPTDSFFHRTIQGVTEELSELRFNTAIAKIMELVNWFYKNKADLSASQKVGFKRTLAVLMAPLTPHLAEEFWRSMGESDSVFRTQWPKADSQRLLEKEIKLAVQINGKMRTILLIKREAEEKEVLTMATNDPKIKKFVGDQKIKKVIYLQGKVLNLVI